MPPRYRFVSIAALFLLATAAGILTGCAGAGFPRAPLSQGTPPGSYSISVIATSGSKTHSTTVTLKVQ